MIAAVASNEYDRDVNTCMEAITLCRVHKRPNHSTALFEQTSDLEAPIHAENQSCNAWRGSQGTDNGKHPTDEVRQNSWNHEPVN